MKSLTKALLVGTTSLVLMGNACYNVNPQKNRQTCNLEFHLNGEKKFFENIEAYISSSQNINFLKEGIEYNWSGNYLLTCRNK